MSQIHDEHYPYIRACIRLAEEAVANGNHPFGSVLVHDGKILLRAQNMIHTMNDIAAHPEIMLARSAASRYDVDFLADCTLYTSTEPCAMCSGGIYWSGIGRVVFACSVLTLRDRLQRGGLVIPCRDILDRGTRPVTIIERVLEEEAFKVHENFWT